MFHQRKLPNEVLLDVLLTSGRILNLINTSDPAVLKTFDRIAESAEAHQVHWYSAARLAGEQVTAEVLAIILHGNLYTWFDGGASRLSDFLVCLESLVDLNPDRFQDCIVFTLTCALEPLAAIQCDENCNDAEMRGKSYNEFNELINILTEADHLKEALNCANVCCNLIASEEDPRFLNSIEQAVHISRQVSDEKLAIREAMLAATLATAAERGERTKIEAFDAIERALRNLPSDEQQRQHATGLLLPWLNKDSYTRLRLLYYLGLPPDKRPELPKTNIDLSLMLPLITDINSDIWLEALLGFTSTYLLIENGRFALEPPLQDHTANADWATWSLRHRAYQRAVPDGSSLLREADLYQLMMTLCHETTHVFSMWSYIGQAILALRAAALEVELRLWSFTTDNEEIDMDELIDYGVAPLEGNDFAPLFQAEHALEITRKIQILQESWQPWFEGIAVFTELAADPAFDADRHHPAFRVIFNLIDHTHPDSQAELTQEDWKKWELEQVQKTEKLYSEAIASEAYFKLRTYLDRYHKHYLAGYLAVRSVVSAWRHTLKQPLDGVKAARLLLHITRWGTAETVPDLALPLQEFRAKTQERLQHWLTRIASVSSEDLEQCLADETPSLWSNGRLVNLENLDEETTPQFGEASIAKLAEQAYRSLSGNNADIYRVPNATLECRTLLKGVAEVLANTQPRSMMQFLNITALPLSVMPIGQVESPFWLQRSLRAISCLIRTTEITESGLPGYNGLTFFLSAEEFASLEQEIFVRGEMRINVTRVADLYRDFAGDEERRPGLNYLVLRYGKWVYVQPRGIIFGFNQGVPPSLYDAIKARCLDQPLISLDAEVIATGLAGAQRTKDWLKTVESWEGGGEKISIPIEPWVKYITALADEVLDDEQRSDRNEVSLDMLRFVLGDEVLAEALQQEGLAAICGDDSEALKEFLHFLNTSAKRPLDQMSLDSNKAWKNLLEKSPYGWDFIAPQVNNK